MPRLLVTYPDARTAREAVRALETAGIPHSEIQIDSPEDDRDELRGEQHDEADEAVFGAGVPAAGATKKAAVGGSIVGIPMGALIGLVMGVIFFLHHALGMIASIIGFGVAGWIVIALYSMFAATTEEQEVTEDEQHHKVVVGVHAQTTKEIERATGALRGTQPNRVHIAY